MTRRSVRLVILVAFVILIAAACSDGVGTTDSKDETTTTVDQTTTVAPTTTTTLPPTTTMTVRESEAPDVSVTVLVYGAEVRSKVAQTGSEVRDGVTVLTLEYVDTIEMSDPRASGTAEWVATLYSPDGNDIGGTWDSEGATLTNEGGTWVGYRTGTYIFTRNMPSALTTTPGVKTGQVHYIGQGGYEGLRMDLYTSSDGIIGSIGPQGQDAATEGEVSPLVGVAATADTVMVHGSWTESTSTETVSESVEGVEITTVEFSDVLEMSDPRASGTMEYTRTLNAIDAGIGGVLAVEAVAIVNEGGTWVGDAMGAYVLADAMPDALTTGVVVNIGEWHLVGTGEYEGLRLDLYDSSDGVTGSIRPVN